MLIHQEIIEFSTPGKGFVNVTAELQTVVAHSGVKVGLCTVFIQHTSASLLIQENADATVLSDLESWMSELAPEHRAWRHDAEGSDDMPGHARSALTRTSESIPVADGRLALGTWQAVYVWEHRHRKQARRLVVHVVGRGH